MPSGPSVSPEIRGHSCYSRKAHKRLAFDIFFPETSITLGIARKLPFLFFSSFFLLMAALKLSSCVLPHAVKKSVNMQGYTRMKNKNNLSAFWVRNHA